MSDDDSKPDIQLTDQIHLNNTMMWDFGLRSDQSENISAIERKIKGTVDQISRFLNLARCEIRVVKSREIARSREIETQA